jgi:hypothetical protein
METTTKITTDNADLITDHAAKNAQLPLLYQDQLTGRIVADIPYESQMAFLNDAPLQRFLSAKRMVWRAISELRNRGGV